MDNTWADMKEILLQTHVSWTTNMDTLGPIFGQIYSYFTSDKHELFSFTLGDTIVGDRDNQVCELP